MQKKIRISEEYVQIYKCTLHISYKKGGAITKAQSGQKLTKKSNLFVSIEITKKCKYFNLTVVCKQGRRQKD